MDSKIEYIRERAREISKKKTELLRKVIKSRLNKKEN